MGTKLKYFFVFILLSASSVSCASNAYLRDQIENANIENIEIIIDESIENSYCKSWSMTAKEIKRYFALASIISGEERHLLYNWGGCNLEGAIKYSDNTNARFSINAGGTAYVLINGQEFYYGCKTTCNALFDFGFYSEEIGRIE